MRKSMCALAAAAMLLLLVSCGGASSQDTTSFGVKYTAPEGWTADESDLGVAYTPGKRPGDATIQLMFSPLDGITTDNAKFYADAVADEIDGSGMSDVSAFTTLAFDVPVGHAVHADATMDVDGEAHSVDMYCTPVKSSDGDTGIFVLMLTLAPDASDATKYKSDFADVVASIDLSGVALPVGSDPAGCDTTVGALTGDPLPDAAAGLYAELRDEYGNDCFVDTSAAENGTIWVDYWSEDATIADAKTAAWDKVVESASDKYADLRAYLDNNGCDNPLAVQLMDPDSQGDTVLVEVDSTGVTYDAAADSVE